jgi:RimJ/RimL family protein N-acetyltransferase
VQPIELPALIGRLVRLVPLEPAHAPALARAAGESRATYEFTTVPDGVDAALRYIERACAERAEGRSVPFATMVGGQVVGSTRFLNIERWDWPRASEDPDAVEIGATWLAASVQRTAVNTEAKLLMLAQAFDGWGVQRVTLKTDARNERSRRAIERLGARCDGILRAWQPASDGAWARDSAIYSILPGDWSGIRAALLQRLDAAGEG